MERIEISSRKDRFYNVISAKSGPENGAFLIYYFDNKNKYWFWEEIESNFVGGGKALTAAFCQEVGRNCLAEMVLLEPDTRLGLENGGCFNELMESSFPIMELKSGEVFDSLKMVRMLRGGGMEPLKITMEKYEMDPEKLAREEYLRGFPISIHLLALT